MKNWLIGKILGFIGKKLDGYKTKIGGVGLILVGVTGIISQIFPDQGLPVVDLETAIGSMAAGLAALGIGHKVEKAKAVIESQEGRVYGLPQTDSLKPQEHPFEHPVLPPPAWGGKTPGQFP